jgi:hypothetical protein
MLALAAGNAELVIAKDAAGGMIVTVAEAESGAPISGPSSRARRVELVAVMITCVTLAT